jgi:hypothetical protein
MTKCTHTSDWWKNQLACICCGALYSDEEAEEIANESTRTFTAKQERIIAMLQAESDEP